MELDEHELQDEYTRKRERRWEAIVGRYIHVTELTGGL